MSDLKNVLIYSSNNSGGSWWLKDEDWKALEDAGWVVHWMHDHKTRHGGIVHPEPEYKFFGHSHTYEHQLVRTVFEGGEWLGAKARSAAIQTDDPEKAIRDWERITRQDSAAEGCNCCGEPHSFTFYDKDGNARYSSVVVTRTERSWW